MLAAVVLALCTVASASTLDKKSAALATAWGRSLAELADCGADGELINLASLSALADYLPALERAPGSERLARLTAFRDAVKHAYDASPSVNLSPEKCRDVVRSVTKRIEDSNRKAEQITRHSRQPPAPARPTPPGGPVQLP